MSKARNLSDFISDPAIDSTELGDASVTTAKLVDQAVTPAKLHNTLDLSSKTVTLATDGISGNSVHGGVISDFASTGIDDNATATALTIDSSNNISITINDSNTTQSTLKGLVVSNTDSTTNNGSAISFAYGANGNSFSKIGVINTDRTGGSEDQDIFFGNLGGGSYSESMRITSTGRVGIGTSNPAAPIHVVTPNSGGGLTDTLQFTDSSGYVDIAMYVGAADGEIRVGAAGQLRGRYAAQYAGTRSAYSFNIGTNNTNAITIDTSQNVGIGVTSPANSLHVQGNIEQNATAYTALSASFQTVLDLDTYVTSWASGIIIYVVGRENGVPGVNKSFARYHAVNTNGGWIFGGPYDTIKAGNDHGYPEVQVLSGGELQLRNRLGGNIGDAWITLQLVCS